MGGMSGKRKQRAPKCPKCGARSRETPVEDEVLRRHFAGIGAHGTFQRVKTTYEVACKCGVTTAVRYRETYSPNHSQK
jgi:hypothetical protein